MKKFLVILFVLLSICQYASAREALNPTAWDYVTSGGSIEVYLNRDKIKYVYIDKYSKIVSCFVSFDDLESQTRSLQHIYYKYPYMQSKVITIATVDLSTDKVVGVKHYGEDDKFELLSPGSLGACIYKHLDNFLANNTNPYYREKQK